LKDEDFRVGKKSKWAVISDRCFYYVGEWKTAFDEFEKLDKGILVEIIGEKNGR